MAKIYFRLKFGRIIEKYHKLVVIQYNDGEREILPYNGNSEVGDNVCICEFKQNKQVYPSIHLALKSIK